MRYEKPDWANHMGTWLDQARAKLYFILDEAPPHIREKFENGDYVGLDEAVADIKAYQAEQKEDSDVA